MILGIRGVMIPIDLVSSTMDSIGQSVVLFKPVPVQTSDPKSEFLCQLSLLCAEPADPPESTLYTWDISHTLVTMYHPYCHSPSALTEYLKQKLHQQRAKCLSHSLPTQVESSVSLERNINSDFTLAATTLDYLDQRGECNVPKRYLKEADWCKDGTLGAGYYIAGLDNPAILILVDFNFKYLQWGCTHPKKDKFILERPAPTRYRLCIFDEERTQDRSCWGPIDGTPDEEEIPDPQFKFGSEAGGDTPDPDIIIPRSQKEEADITMLTQLILSHISKPPIQPRSLAGAMAQIASTTTLTASMVARTLRTGVSQQPWTSHGLHGSWVGRRRESLRIHGQLTSADVGDSHYFLGSADVGQKRRKVYTISCVLKVRRCTQCLGNKLQHFYICDFKSGHQIISLSI